MKMKKIITTGILILFAVTVVAQTKRNKETLEKYASDVKKEMETINKALFKHISKSIPYSGFPSRKTNVTVYLSDTTVRKLVYDSYDDSFTSSGPEIYYFNNTGKLISHESKVTGSPMQDIFLDRKVLVYSKIGKSESYTEYSENMDADYILAGTKFIVDYYLSNFLPVKYETFDVSRNNSIILKTITATPLHSSPNANSSIINNLAKGTELIYLERSSNPESLNGKDSWIWYKVKTKQN